MYGVGGEKLAHLCTAAHRPQRTLLIPEAELERKTKRQRQAESETRGERDQR